MSDSDRLHETVEALVDEFGYDDLLAAAKNIRNRLDQSLELTIICNKGLHPLPSEILRGEVFAASEGQLDFSTPVAIAAEMEKIVRRTAEKVKSRKWDRVYVVPHGHSAISMQIKLLCYRVLGVETVDWFYTTQLGYTPIELGLRTLLLDDRA